jgi:hypothetical protein
MLELVETIVSLSQSETVFVMAPGMSYEDITVSLFMVEHSSLDDLSSVP